MIFIIYIFFNLCIFIQTFETILRSLYDLLGSNNCIHQPVTDDTVEKHTNIIFEVEF